MFWKHLRRVTRWRRHASAWAGLPNAACIVAVLEDVKARPKVWEQVTADIVAGSKDRTAAWAEAYRVSRDVVRDPAWLPAMNAACDGLGDVAERAVGDAVCALIAWDESAALLDLTPDALRTIISTCDRAVKYQAVLLLPAVIVRSNT